MKVVESVQNNVEVKKPKKFKVQVQCRDFDKPKGDQCRFFHGIKQGLKKCKNCAYWMDGNCHYSEKDCWNIHNPAKKGQKLEASNETERQSVFQNGQEQHGLPPGQKKAAHRMNCEGGRNTQAEKRTERRGLLLWGRRRRHRGRAASKRKMEKRR